MCKKRIDFIEKLFLSIFAVSFGIGNKRIKGMFADIVRIGNVIKDMAWTTFFIEMEIKFGPLLEEIFRNQS